jgi:hypothetical protein
MQRETRLSVVEEGAIKTLSAPGWPTQVDSDALIANRRCLGRGRRSVCCEVPFWCGLTAR